MIRILLADDHAMVRRGIATTITRELTVPPVVCDEASTGAEALEMIAGTTYTLAIIDISMPGMDGIETLTRIKKTTPQLPVLIISMHPEEQYGLRALRAGAAGYLSKEQAADDLLTAIKVIVAGSRYISPNLTSLLVAKAISDSPEEDSAGPSHNILSNREFQVMKLLAEGKILKEIAFDLEISIKTVSTFKRRIFEKMRFTSITDLIRYVEKYLIPTPLL